MRVPTKGFFALSQPQTSYTLRVVHMRNRAIERHSCYSDFMDQGMPSPTHGPDPVDIHLFGARARALCVGSADAYRYYTKIDGVNLDRALKKTARRQPSGQSSGGQTHMVPLQITCASRRVLQNGLRMVLRRYDVHVGPSNPLATTDFDDSTNISWTSTAPCQKPTGLLATVVPKKMHIAGKEHVTC